MDSLLRRISRCVGSRAVPVPCLRHARTGTADQMWAGRQRPDHSLTRLGGSPSLPPSAPHTECNPPPNVGSTQHASQLTGATCISIVTAFAPGVSGTALVSCRCLGTLATAPTPMPTRRTLRCRPQTGACAAGLVALVCVNLWDEAVLSRCEALGGCVNEGPLHRAEARLVSEASDATLASPARDVTPGDALLGSGAVRRAPSGAPGYGGVAAAGASDGEDSGTADAAPPASPARLHAVLYRRNTVDIV